ncbi:UNVERIFIED_ORG: hypothetical protein ABIC81_002902 [Bacillus proteolyticus]|nr:Uncharacterized protein BCINRASA_01804 [Bacillus wiedmannii]
MIYVKDGVEIIQGGLDKGEKMEVGIGSAR